MTAYLQTTAGREEISLQEGTFLVSVSTNDGKGNNCTLIQTGLEDVFPYRRIQRITPEGVNINIDCVFGEDPAYQEILERYRGISMVELVMFDFQLTIII